MLFLRSLVFNLAWYLNIIVQMIVQTPVYFLLPREKAWAIPKNWALTNHFLQRWIVGTKLEVLGEENIPDGGFIIASKHQSIWEFYALCPLFRDPAFVLKSQLMKIPLFGWYVAKMRMIPIEREKRGKALAKMLSIAKKEIRLGRQILIFPEGTRKAPGDEPDYKYGITRLYLELNCPVLPVALTSGLYWPRRRFMRYPGTVRISILEPIMPGLSADEFAAELQRRIETECDRLYALSAEDPVPPPISERVQARIDRYKAVE